MSNFIRILIADDHPLVRKGLSSLLTPRNGMEIIGEATNGKEAVELAHQLQPDVVLMDMVMPEMSGAEARRQIMAHDPDTQVLILTSFADHEDLLKAFQAGALGCLIKDSPPDDLLHSIRTVHRGQFSIPQSLAFDLMNHPSKAHMMASPITEREQEIAALVAEGLSNKEIARELGLSANTIRSHVSSVLRKLELSNRTQIAIYLKDNAAIQASY